MRIEIAAKLNELKRYTKLLEGYRERTLDDLEKDLTLRGAVERYMQLSIEIVIEIGEMIIANEGFKKPESYREVIEILGDEGILAKPFAKKFAPAAGFRNILVHRYGELEFDELHHHLQNDLGDFNEFAKQIALFLKKN